MAQVSQFDVDPMAIDPALALRSKSISSLQRQFGTRMLQLQVDSLDLSFRRLARVWKVLLVSDHLDSSCDTVRVYLQLQHTRAELTLQGRNVTSILEQAQGQWPLDQRQIGTPVPLETHRLDALLCCLEDRFRGSREEIKERFRRYLPYIRATGVVDGALIVDLGCGRGRVAGDLK